MIDYVESGGHLRMNEATYSKQKRIMKWPHWFCSLGISRREADTRQLDVVIHQNHRIFMYWKEVSYCG